MALLFPLALGLTALGVPILLMHLRRTRHRERVTSSLVMWRRVAQESSPRTSRPRLLVNPLLLLQLLALLILVLALAQPAYTHADAVTGDVILIVDQSYGMQARDVAPSRFAEAMRRADRLARDVGPGS